MAVQKSIQSRAWISKAMLTLVKKVNFFRLDEKMDCRYNSLYGKRKTRNLRWNVERIDVMIRHSDLAHIFTLTFLRFALLMEALRLWNNIQWLLCWIVRIRNGYYIDGPILEKDYSSFVGMHPIPVVMGWPLENMEDDQMEKKWLKNNLRLI